MTRLDLLGALAKSLVLSKCRYCLCALRSLDNMYMENSWSELSGGQGPLMQTMTCRVRVDLQ